jgi:3'-phosphoadenosine 5'-phosphosulfate (PAPS) 3'-phosphatase
VPRVDPTAERVLPILLEAVLAGGAAVLAVRRSGRLRARYKAADELVTRADDASDQAIARVLARRLPLVDPTIGRTLEESGSPNGLRDRRVGADPLDGTSHFAAGGTLYSVQAHYVANGRALAGVILQPELHQSLADAATCLGRLVWAVRGGGAFMRRTAFSGGQCRLGPIRRVPRVRRQPPRRVVACVPLSMKMAPAGRRRALRLLGSDLVGATTGTGGAGGNVLMTVFGGQDLYANFGAGHELDLAPPEVIAAEVGLTVWDDRGRRPDWRRGTQPVIVSTSAALARQVLVTVGL